MFIIYDLIFLVISIFYLPVYILRRKFQPGFSARLGVLPKGLDLDHPIWIHAVSVGEAQAVRVLIKELSKAYPQKKIVISTVTATGNKIAKSIAQEKDFVTYLPLDFSFFVRKIIDKIDPAIFILAETEIWPNLLSHLYKRNIPVVVVNGRISDSSFKGYGSIKFLAKPILNKISFFGVQTERDAERLHLLGVVQDKIKVTGNMKFDILSAVAKDYSDYRHKLGLKDKERLLICGSTHPGEEKIILAIYKELLRGFHFLRLLIAPRHPERAAAVAAFCKSRGFEPVRISGIAGYPSNRISGDPVFILDTIGELTHYYTVADIVFVGGSLVKKGGHNILEPAALGKPVIFGNFMFNFKDIAELFLNNQAAVSVRSAEELKDCLRGLLLDDTRAMRLSAKAKELIVNNQGASLRNLEIIKHVIKTREQIRSAPEHRKR